MRILNSDEAYDLLVEANITKNKQTFLRWVREGRIQGEMRNKREGYKFKEKTIKHFIENFIGEEQISPLEELETLREENQKLKMKIKLPDSMIKAENMKLVQTIRLKDQEIVNLRNELEKMKEDNTIRIRIE